MKTINVDKDLCTKCGICSTVCITDIIEPGDERTIPRVAEKKAANCVLCGHCEAFCPTQALILNLRPEERQILPPDAGTVSPETMEFYLKKRRSIRHFLADSVPREKILKILDISRYAASGMNGQPVKWIVVHDYQMDGEPPEYRPPHERLCSDAHRGMAAGKRCHLPRSSASALSPYS